MTFAESALRWQRWLLAAMHLGSAVIILPAAVEPFMLPKMTFLLLVGVALGGLTMARAAWTRVLHAPVSPVMWAVLAFAAALVLTTITSPTPWASAVGFYARYTGLVPYLMYLLVFLLVVRRTDAALTRLLLRAGLVALGLVIGYGLLQAAGADPITYTDTRRGTTFSFLGNVNFSSAWAGCLLAPAVVVAVDRSASAPWRWYATALLPLTVGYVVITGTIQGLGTAVLAVLATGLVLATGAGTRLGAAVRQRPRAALMVAAGATAVAAATSAGAVLLFRTQLDRALTDRPDFWLTALRIFADRPLLGTGLDTYAHHFLAERPVSLALSDGVERVDAPHSVLLGMFSNGGLVLGVSYVVVVLLVGAALIRGLVTVDESQRSAFAAFAGIWVGYQAQSLVSFDVPPLALLHWMSAGVVVALAAPLPVRTVLLPGHRPAPVTKRGRTLRSGTPASTKAALAAVGMLSLLAGWFALYPLRADLVAASAAPLGREGRLEEAGDRFRRATELNPAEASYSLLVARALEAAGRPADAFTAALQAAERDPGGVQYALFAARQAQEAGLRDEATRWYQAGIDKDPNNPLVLNEAAAYFLNTGELVAAEDVASRAVALRADVDILLVLGRAQEGQGELAEARVTYEQALQREPGNETVQGRLARLTDQG
jgi:O-antigen ligase/Flp pilus assembly protein TadD